MSPDSSRLRVVNFNLGVNLGWLQQGAAFGGRPTGQMSADLGRVQSTAATAGYQGYSALVDNALRELNSGQPANSALNEISGLITLFQGQARGVDAAALSLGIVLGWLQQGAEANNRPASMARDDLNSARTHAANAGYHSYEVYINNALAKLSSGLPVSSIFGEVTALIGFFQGQG